MQLEAALHSKNHKKAIRIEIPYESVDMTQPFQNVYKEEELRPTPSVPHPPLTSPPLVYLSHKESTLRAIVYCKQSIVIISTLGKY